MRDHGAHIDNSAHSFMAWSRIVIMKKVKQNTLNSRFNGLTSANNSKNNNNTHSRFSQRRFIHGIFALLDIPKKHDYSTGANELLIM